MLIPYWPSAESRRVYVTIRNKTGHTLTKGTEVHVPSEGLKLDEPLLLTADGVADMDIPHGQKGLIRLYSATFHRD